MDTWVALLRGINLGGHNMVPMAALRQLCAGLGWTRVRSYIASGNLVFAAKGTAETLAKSLRQTMVALIGVDVPVLVLPGVAVRAALAGCPFEPEAGRHVHAFFLWDEPVVDWSAYAICKVSSENLQVLGRVAYLFAPDGIGRSNLAEKLHKVLTGTEMTARNLNTLRKLVEMLDDMAPG